LKVALAGVADAVRDACPPPRAESADTIAATTASAEALVDGAGKAGESDGGSEAMAFVAVVS